MATHINITKHDFYNSIAHRAKLNAYDTDINALNTQRVTGEFVAATANVNVIGGVPVIHRIDAPDGTGNTNVTLTHRTLVTDIVVVKQGGAGGAADTVTVLSTAAAITNAMNINVADLIVVRPTTIDDANTDIAAGGILRVAINDGGAGASSACRVIVHGLRVD